MTKNKMIKKLMLLIPLTATFTQVNATNQFKALNAADFVRSNQGKVGITPKQYKTMLKTLTDNMADDDLILVTPKTNNKQIAATYSITFKKSKNITPPPATQTLLNELYSEQYKLANVKPLILNINDTGTNYEKTLLNLVTANLSESDLLDDQDPITNFKQLNDADYGRIAAEYAYYFDEETWLPNFCSSYEEKRELPANEPAIRQGTLFSKTQLLQQLEQSYTDQAFNKVSVSHSGFMFNLKKRDDNDPIQQQSFLYQLARHGAIAHIKAPAQGNATIQIANAQVDATALTNDAQAILAEMSQAQGNILKYEEEVKQKLNTWNQLVDDFTSNLQADDQTNAQIAQQLGVTVGDNKSSTLTAALKQLYATQYKPGEVLAIIDKMIDLVQPPQKATENNPALTPTTATGDNHPYDDTLKRIQAQQ